MITPSQPFELGSISERAEAALGMMSGFLTFARQCINERSA